MIINFKEWLKNELLLEFKASNIYDFYALELAKDKIDSKEIQHLIIDRGNALIQDILSAMGFVLFRRYAVAAHNCASDQRWWNYNNSGEEYFSFPDDKDISKHDVHFKNEVKQEYEKYYEFLVHAYEEGVVRTEFQTLVDMSPKNYKMWLGLSGQKQKDLVMFTRKLMLFYAQVSPANCSFAVRSASEAWNKSYEYYINHMSDDVITNPNAIIKSVNELMQMVHNSGSFLEYMPRQLDYGLHVRDRATLPQLLSGASDSVREILKSASLGSAGLMTQPMPAMPELLETAITRQLSKFQLNHVSLESYEKQGIDYTAIYKFDANFDTSNIKPTQLPKNEPNYEKLEFDVEVFIPAEKRYSRKFALSADDPTKTQDNITPSVTLLPKTVKNSVLAGLTPQLWDYMLKNNNDLTKNNIYANSRLDLPQFGLNIAQYAYEVKRTLNVYFDNKLKLGVYTRSAPDLSSFI